MSAGWASETDVAETIKKVYDENGYLLDPLTAVAMKDLLGLREQSGDNTYTIITATASPFKFAESVWAALQRDNFRPVNPWEAIQSLSELSGWKIPEGL